MTLCAHHAKVAIVLVLMADAAFSAKLALAVVALAAVKA